MQQTQGRAYATLGPGVMTNRCYITGGVDLGIFPDVQNP